jgi:hypothetical protein
LAAAHELNAREVQAGAVVNGDGGGKQKHRHQPSNGHVWLVARDETTARLGAAFGASFAPSLFLSLVIVLVDYFPQSFKHGETHRTFTFLEILEISQPQGIEV